MVARRLLVAIATFGMTMTLSAQTPETPSPAEYRIKAVFLFNFVQFVEWPASAFANESAPLVICVAGDDPFGATLDQTIEGESIDKRSLVVRRVRDPEDLPACHLLFVSRSEQARLRHVLQAVGGSAPVLIVSDMDGFVARGGTIGFFLDRNRVRFEISPLHAQRRGLKLSSQLLSLGRIHSDPEERR